MMFSCRQQKMCLIKMLTGCYFSPAVTLLAVGCRNPVIRKATLSALSAFFVVATIALAPFYGVVYRMFTVTGRELLRSATDTSRHHVMVALAGPLSGGPVPFRAGIPTPVRAIASECRNSSDSHYTIERRLPSWLRPQPKNTQNPRSTTRMPFPNSATTFGARLSVSKSFHSGYTSTISVLLRWLPRILFMPFPTSTMILRM
ncbi:hypothetical protein AID08_05880 [Salmonella enterica subsp. enterica serovar Minnesota]|nr:hypothetical protein [Salmonella enterica subsp. enterica serovar Minnesota]EBZ3811058.1 hypothetical protein [Salmonella enterica subsp. enterica serovar Minnesota]